MYDESELKDLAQASEELCLSIEELGMNASQFSALVDAITAASARMTCLNT